MILAAGYGSRLEGVSSETDFKPLTPLHGEPLIFRTIESLKTAGCTEIIIVLGYGHTTIKKAILESYKGSIPLRFIYNEKYNLSNGVSLLAAKEYAGELFILTMADHVLGDSLMKIAGDYDPDPGTAALLVDYKTDSVFDMDDATKVLAEDGYIRSIGKRIDAFNCIDTGVFVCTQALINSIEKVYQSRGDASISDGVQDLASRNRMYALDIGDGFWQDVDTPEMFQYAEKMIERTKNNSD